jgi:hypothetical protein
VGSRPRCRTTLDLGFRVGRFFYGWFVLAYRSSLVAPHETSLPGLLVFKFRIALGGSARYHPGGAAGT